MHATYHKTLYLREEKSDIHQDCKVPFIPQEQNILK